MATFSVVFKIIILIFLHERIIATKDCEDLIYSCRELQSFCIGSNLYHQLSLTTQFNEEIDSSTPMNKKNASIRESLPLIRNVVNPTSKKRFCKTCKKCPKLLEIITSFITSLCPSTCKVCDISTDLQRTSESLAKIIE